MQIHQSETVPLEDSRSGSLPMNSHARSDIFTVEPSSHCERIQHNFHDDGKTGTNKPHHVIADYQPSAHKPSRDYERTGTRMPSIEHTHGPSGHEMGRNDSRGEEQYAEPSPAEPKERPAEEKEGKKKKKKKKSKKKELEALMANIPDGPPPPLYPDGQSVVINSPEVSLPYSDEPYSDVHIKPPSSHYPEGLIEAERVNSGNAQAEFSSPASHENLDSGKGTFPSGAYLDQQGLRPKKQKLRLPQAHIPSGQLDSAERQSSPYPINDPLKEESRMKTEDHSQGSMSHLSEKDYLVAKQTVQREGGIAQLSESSVKKPNGNNEVHIYREPMQRSQGSYQVAAHAGNAASRGDKIYPTNMRNTQEDFAVMSSRRADITVQEAQPETTPHPPKAPEMRLRDETNWQNTPRKFHAQADNYKSDGLHGKTRSDVNRSYEKTQFPPPQQYCDPATSLSVSAQAMHKKSILPQSMAAHAMAAHAIPPQAMPPQAMPPQAMPPQAMPPQAMPPQAMPPQAMPPQAMPAHSMPAHSMPAHSMPARSMPAHTMPAHTMPFMKIPANSAPVHGRPGQPVPAQAMRQMYHAPPPQGYFPPPPQQAYGYQHPSMMHQPPAGVMYPQPHRQRNPQPINVRPSTSGLAMMNRPPTNGLRKSSKPDKASLRAALNQGTFGI